MPTTVSLAPPKARIDVVLSAFGMAIAFALQNADITNGTVFVGWPKAEDLRQTLASGRFFVTIYPQQISRRIPDRLKLNAYKAVPPTVTLTAAVANGVITFAGTAQENLNIHTFLGYPRGDAQITTSASDTLDSIAVKAATAITALNVPGVTASAANYSVTVTGPRNVTVNIGGTGTITREVDRIERRIQVSVWAPSADNPRNPLLGLRTAVAEVIHTAVGTMLDPFLPLGDGTYAWVRYQSEASIDAGQSDFHIYEQHIMYTAEYGLPVTMPATQISAVVNSVNPRAPFIAILG